MIAWRLENNEIERICYRAERIVDELVDTFGLDEDVAEDAALWAELSCRDDVYQVENVTITVIDE